MMPVLLILLLTFSVFVGCGDKGAGVSTDSQTSHDTKQGSQLDRTKTLTTEKRTTAMITVPVVPLIGEAWEELLRAEEHLPDNATCERVWDTALEGKSIEEKDESTAITCAFALSYIYAFTPTMGWPVEPKSEKGGSYMLRTISHVLYVNNLASDIAAQVTASSYQNPREAKAAIKQMLTEQRAYLLQLYSASFDIHLMRGIIDLANSKDVMFAKGAYHVTLGPGGAVIKYSGVDWFGNGNLSGKRYELQLASMTGVAMKRGQTVTSTSEQKVGEGDKAQAGVGK